MKPEKRSSSISFSKSDTQIQDDHPSELIDEEHAQLSLDPTLQTYLAEVSQHLGCWGRFLPIPFERASQKSWWDPTFDSEILEKQYKKSSSRYLRYKFRCSLWYILLVSLSWFIYFIIMAAVGETNGWQIPSTIFGIAFLINGGIITIVTYTNLCKTRLLESALATAITLCFISLFLVYMIPITFDTDSFKLTSEVSPVGQFSICIEILLILYTLIPLKFYMCISIGCLYSVCFEILSLSLVRAKFDIHVVLVRILTQICIHLIALHILIMTNVRLRNTFMKVGQSLLVRRQLESEKKLKENMLHSLMPPSVAQWLLNDDENFTKSVMEQRQTESDNEPKILMGIFRPFNMNRMEKVSILFADIVGFTKMSSNKSAEELVEILNNLFQRFDLLCKFHNCEKIATLGDCYYCVSGCPEPRNDHAMCCVEMGLSMIQAIKQFDNEKNEGVNMRVGVHTGTVLYGIVGIRRFKFDVWSNDVSLANRMESTGEPGMVHISQQTLEFLDDQYLVDEGDAVFGMKTYFIMGRKGDRTPSYSGSFRAEGRQKYAHSLQLFVSPPTTSPSMSPQTRPRVLSCDTTSSFLTSRHNPNMLSPDICKIKASSLPSILDSDGEQDQANGSGGNQNKDEEIKTPTSTASSGKYNAPKSARWRIPKFLKKSESKGTDENDLENNSHSPQTAGGYKQVPMIIETSTTPVLNGKKKDSWIVDQPLLDTTVLFPPIDTEDDASTLDVKSYISQSRSDMHGLSCNTTAEFARHFVRGGSYRSQRSSRGSLAALQRAGSNKSGRGRSPSNFDIILPAERSRSATVTVGSDLHKLVTGKSSFDAATCSRLSVGNELECIPHDNGSRKDSGIKSNSRRSSIQQIDSMPYDQLQQRVSGYYTSSQSTVNSPHQNIKRVMPSPFFDKYGTCIQNLRKQSDRQLIKCVQENFKSKSSYFIKPPLSPFTLFFTDDKMEKDYRANAYKIGESDGSIITLATSKFNTYFDIFVATFVFLIAALALVTLHGLTVLWMTTFLILIFVHIIAVIFCLKYILGKKFENNDTEYGYRKNLSIFYHWNMLGAILVSLPIIIVTINFCTGVIVPFSSDYLYTFLLLICIVHFCNFTQLNCWMKNFLATLGAFIFIALFLSNSCPATDNLAKEQQHSHYLYKWEIVMNISLIIILVWLLNREFEITYRLSFHTGYMAHNDQLRVQLLKNQADYLIYNIVPEHVADQLKKNAKYSENFTNVGIIFASIVNFTEMYDESYKGGKEFLRVLNELIADFDDLLTRDDFRHVEKIKTIGSTFMAASGLNSQLRSVQSDPYEHLYSLMDYAIEMQNVISNFNRHLLEFNLILRVGFNIGEVTAAVIGNTKLYYDIWGDAVNIASRMDTTGVNGCIQVGEHCVEILQNKFVLKERGTIFVKGKDNMKVFLLERKKAEFEEEV